MPNSPISPSIGRIVLFRALTHGGDYPAIVAFVHDDDNIDLFVFDNNAQTTYHYPNVPFDDADTPTKASWHWMPYQLTTAKDDPAKSPPAKS